MLKKRYQVFISSTFTDLKEQRRKVWETLIEFDYIVAGMEFFPPTNEQQFEYIKKEIEASDYYILIIAGRYGSLAPDEKVSFTEKEFDFAKKLEIPILVFPIDDPTNVSVKDTDQDLEKHELLILFRQKACSARIVSKWDSTDKLCLNIVKGLQHAIEAYPRAGWIPAIFQPNADLIAQNSELRTAIDRLKEETSRVAEERKAKNNLTEFLRTDITIPYTYRSAFRFLEPSDAEQKSHFDVAVSELFYDAAEVALSTLKSSEKIDALIKKLDEHHKHIQNKRIDRKFIRDIIIILASRDLIDMQMVGHENGFSEDWRLTKLGQHIFANMRLSSLTKRKP